MPDTGFAVEIAAFRRAGRRFRRGERGAAVARAGSLLLEQEFDAGSLYQLRQAAAHATAGLSEARTLDVMVVVHGLAANTVRHGAGWGRLRIWGQDAGGYRAAAGEGDPLRAEEFRAACDARADLIRYLTFRVDAGDGHVIGQVPLSASSPVCDSRSCPDGNASATFASVRFRGKTFSGMPTAPATCHR